ncbi:MAG: MarR family transcriptional regulator [Armatimonadaceae bacterium]
MPTHFAGSDEERRALDVYIKLQRCAESVASRALVPVMEAGLTPSQFGVLEALYHLGSLTLSQIAEKHLKSRNNFTVVVDNLEKLGMVRRERDQNDRRVIFVHLTDTGKQAVETVLPLHVAEIVEIVRALSPEERDALNNLLRCLGKGKPQNETGESQEPPLSAVNLTQ